jgi:hypothetical protein
MRLKQKWLAKSQDISAQLNQGESFLALPLILYDGLTGCVGSGKSISRRRHRFENEEEKS